MKYAIALVLGVSLFGCAGAQTKIDHIQAQVNCYLDLAQPYAAYLTEDQLKEITNGMDFTEILHAVGVTLDEIEAVKAGLKACKEIR